MVLITFLYGGKWKITNAVVFLSSILS
jgi:hypothetical protein